MSTRARQWRGFALPATGSATMVRGERSRTATWRRYWDLMLFATLTLPTYCVFTGDVRFFKVPSTSMQPTLTPGDCLVTHREPVYARGDIVVFRDPEGAKEYLVKRVVAVEGDQVEIRFGVLLLNGAYIPEPYLGKYLGSDYERVTVHEGHVFVLGDDRSQSEDSPPGYVAVGEGATQEPMERVSPDPCVPQTSIVGKVRYRYWPPSRWGVVPTCDLGAGDCQDAPLTYWFYAASAMDCFSKAQSGELEWSAAAAAWRLAREYAQDDMERIGTWMNEARAWQRAGDLTRARACVSKVLRLDHRYRSFVARNLLAQLDGVDDAGADPFVANEAAAEDISVTKTPDRILAYKTEE